MNNKTMNRESNHTLVIFFLCACLTAFGQAPVDKGIGLYETRKFTEAEKIFSSIPSTSSSFAAAQYYLGRIAFDKKDYEKAAEYFETATAKNTKKSDYFNYLGIASAEVAKTASIFSKPSWASQARKSWETAIALDSKTIAPRLSLIDYYSMVPGVMGGSMDKAKAMANEVMKLNEAEGHWRLGSLLASENNASEAEEEFAKMVKANPDYVKNLATYYSNQKKYEKAVDLFEEALKRTPDDYPTLYQYGKTSAIGGLKLDRGEECLKRYLTYTPEYGEPSIAAAYMRLGQIREKKGNKAEAKKNYEMALKLDDSLKDAKTGLERVK